MFKENGVREIALGIAIKNNKLLVSKGIDEVKEITFYRCLGGGMEENETPIETVKREFKEELNIKIKVNKEVGVIDNKFIYNGKSGHEIVHLFDIEIDDKDYKEIYTVIDDDGTSFGEWISIDEFKSGEKILFPNDMIQYL